MFTLPLFQYPTTTVWIDDDKEFLQMMKFKFKDSDNLQKGFTKPMEGVDFLSVQKPLCSKFAFLHSERNSENYDLQQHAPIDFDIARIANLRDCKERLHEISTLVCDHNMPEMNGLELCEKLQKLPFKKILLTGEKIETEVVEAFNDGIINRYTAKGTEDLFKEISKFIKIAIRQYFCELTKPLLSHLETDNPLPLSDSAFVAFFDNWCKENKITEFYLIDKQGSFLAITAKGEPHYFIVHTERSLNNFVKFYSDNSEVSNLMQAVKDRKKIPFFGQGKEAWQIDNSVWARHFYDAQVFPGRERYYCTMV